MGRAGRFIAELVDETSRCSDGRVALGWMLARLQRIIPCESAIFVPAAFDRPVALNREPRHQLIFEHIRRNQPRVLAGLDKARPLALYRDNEVFTSSERRNLAFYAEVVRPQGITSQLVARLQFRGQPAGVLYLCRHDRVRPFASAQEE